MSTKHPAQQAKERETREVADIYNVVSELLVQTAHDFSLDKLEWLRKSGETAQASLANFAALLKAIGMNAMCEEKSEAFRCNETLARMLFVFSDYVRYLDAMILVADFSNEKLQGKHSLEE